MRSTPAEVERKGSTIPKAVISYRQQGDDITVAARTECKAVRRTLGTRVFLYSGHNENTGQPEYLGGSVLYLTTNNSDLVKMTSRNFSQNAFQGSILTRLVVKLSGLCHL